MTQGAVDADGRAEVAALTAAACLFHGFSDRSRLSIVQHLALGEHRVVDLTRHLGLAQSTVSKHLACLLDCGIVTVRPQGRASVYALAHPAATLRPASRRRDAARASPATPWCSARGTARGPARDRPRSEQPLGDRPSTPSSSAERRRQLGRRAQLLAGASVAYNLVEAAVAVSAGLVAGSVALVGFGLDSIVEVSSGLVVLWQFRHPLPETRERQALRLMAVSFFALAAYVTVESVRSLSTGHAAEHSPVGITLAAVSLVTMPVLSWAQRRTGRQLGSATVVADSTQTLLCTYLSAVLLVGLVRERDTRLVLGGPGRRSGRSRRSPPRRDGTRGAGEACCVPTSSGTETSCTESCSQDCRAPAPQHLTLAPTRHEDHR